MKTDLLKTEEAITLVKETFSEELTKQLKLSRVSSPIAILDGTGINDDLNGTERPVAFTVKALAERRAVVVQSLAKWKRLRLGELEIEPGRGIITDMRALRPDEEFSSIHSIYVDQWDWEKHILERERTIDYLKATVIKIYEALKTTEKIVNAAYPETGIFLPDQIKFMHSEELVKLYPGLSPGEREQEAAKRYGALFIIGIGHTLTDGQPHDGRAPDYDDWSTLNQDGLFGLNGDIIVWNGVLQKAFELSSMGIRVDKESLIKQLNMCGCPERTDLLFHSLLLEDRLPLSIGGGIGQSRLCMYLLRKSHIGEVQVGIWPENMNDNRDSISVRIM